jgi:tyrosine-protein phosphatase SIW14
MTMFKRLGRAGSLGRGITLGRSITPALLFILLISLRGGAVAETAKPAYSGLPNCHLVAPGIYRGAAPTAEGFATLQALGVRTIIDLRIEKAARIEQQDAEKLGFGWIHLPMGKEAPTQQQVDTLLSHLAKAPGTPVYVHCQYGADRTGCMIGIYRAQVQGWSFSQAWAEMRQYGFKPWLSELKAAVRSRAKAE